MRVCEWSGATASLCVGGTGNEQHSALVGHEADIEANQTGDIEHSFTG
jgi:hypothetical protein